MRVTIGIPAYNAEKYLRQTVDSILAQPFTDWELLLINDGSTDGTPALAQEYCQRDERVRVIHQANAGLPAARNSAYRERDRTAEYIIFIDADDLWEPDTLETLVKALDARPDVLGVYGVAKQIDSDGQPYLPGEMEAWCRERKTIRGNRVETLLLDAPTDFATLAYHQCIATAGSLLLRANAFEKAGLFDTELRSSEDWEMWLRLCLHGNLAFVDKAVIGYRFHISSMSRNLKRMRETELLVRHKLLAAQGITEEQRRLIRLGYKLWEQHKGQDKLAHARMCLSQKQFTLAAKQCVRAARNYALSWRGLPA